MRPPNQRAIKIERGISRIEAERIRKPNSDIIRSPAAKPSIPSVMFTAFEKVMIKKAEIGINQIPKSMTPMNGTLMI